MRVGTKGEKSWVLRFWRNGKGRERALVGNRYEEEGLDHRRGAMKSGRPHRVPLTGRALKLLEELPREDDNPHVFVGGRRAKGMSNMAMLILIWSMKPGTTVHGFRSSFRDFASERTTFAREVAEAALAHVIGDKTETAYARSDLFEKRRSLMADWARFLR